ncbi:MAG: hypothetical protein HY974_04715, partial [Candidatus Kerfeldbacteria bacterium]|nr:hypothetical protein [Candidatus Kerfeldbacteria bacterium]
VHEYYAQPGRKLSYPKQVAWCSFEKLLAGDVAAWIFKHQGTPPVIDLYTSGLNPDKLDEVELSGSDQVVVAMIISQSLMFVCRKLNQEFRARPSVVTPDMRSARRQLRQWCTQAGREYCQLRNGQDKTQPAVPADQARARNCDGYTAGPSHRHRGYFMGD